MNGHDDIFDAGQRDTMLELSAYALDHMDEQEREAFEGRLGQDPELAEKLAEERAFIEDFRGALPPGMPRADGFDRLPLVSRERNTWARGLIAATVAALAVGLVLLIPQPEPAFETLSSDTPAGVEGGYRYRIVIQDSVDAGARADLLAQYGLEIVESQGAGGSIVAGRTAPLEPPELAALRQVPGVSLVELQYRD